ncbi:DNA topoisomerase-1 [Parvibaculum indicum]|uniref:type I DNA topoisomerase n=1 Tax=Parvibaculum indicum TaxID=562969 RepID=UPI0014220A28|nr:type I DNA topoisomerase [Parvibaculum indicum]NIJ40039.1 DNA topoisomerase-1 [Parvibaculum indicum]
MDVVIVESPAKAKTINKYLGKDYKVMASYGHVRDLPSKDGSVQPDEDFAMHWDVDAKSQKRLNDIVKAVKDADGLILATDPDREGEAISWHVLEVLRNKKALGDKDVKRVVFNAITKQSVTEAMKHPRDLDKELIDAYLARRALDYLVGFTLSPVLWRKLPGSRSAGRVQSVALRLVCDRELEIESFRAQEYWTVESDFQTEKSQNFIARLTQLDGKKLDKFAIPDEKTAKDIEARIRSSKFTVTSVESKPTRRNPNPPFTTSTLQQEASRKLGFSASRTMQVAQRLYEGVELDGETTGLITYMRTDGVQIADEAIAATRTVVNNEFGEAYLPDSPRVYKTKAKNAQEAHEAIRPTELSRLPKKVAHVLDDDQRRLYELIWNRTVASQMESVQLERTTIEIEANDAPIGLRATGSVIVFDGFLRLYQEGKDDEAADGEDGNRLPRMAKGDKPSLVNVRPDQHFTEPPPRFTEATLVKRMEELGIGRPSTYASTLQTLRDRGYVTMDKNRLVPDDKGRLVTAFLENFFERYVEYGFTADLEEKLDKVSAGELDWKELLRDFWKGFTGTVEDIADLRITEVLDRLNEVLAPHVFPEKEDGSDPRKCPTCEDGRLSLKVGKFGAFVGCSNYPECRFTRPLTAALDADSAAATGDRALGEDPDTGAEITLKSGRFGPYVERAPLEEGEKPKRSGLPNGLAAADVDLEKALKLLTLPREIGLHPETGKKVTAGLGRFGPYIYHDGTYANIKDPEELFTIGLNRALTVLAEKIERAEKRAGKILKELGEHPDTKKPVQIREGKYGPYIRYGTANVTLPKGTEADDVTFEQALELIAEKVPAKGKKKAAAKKTATKTAAKKPAAKKTATTKKAPAKKPAAKKKPAASKTASAKAKTE